ncbi:VMAP-C domain-containing protein [Streptomyces sp. NPDC002073]
MDPRRLALIHGGTARQRHSVGSGYLIAPRLVLTARHVLADGPTGPFWPQIRVRVGHPREGEGVRTGASVLWTHPRGLDVALLLTDDEVDVPGPVHWGRPVGKTPLRYEGLGYPLAAAADDEGREAEHLRGVLPLLSSGSRDLYVLDQDPAPDPRPDGRKPWGGASGTAVFCEDRLVAVVIHDDRAYGNRRLRACPARAFTQDSGFDEALRRYAGGPPRLAELCAPLPQARPAADPTPAEKTLARMLWPLLGDPDTCSAHGRDLALRLGYKVPAGYAPAIPDLAALLLEHPRALASLGTTLALAATTQDARDRLTELLLRARTLGFGSLLSVDEHERLLDLLHGICKEHPALLPRAAREALRYAFLPDPLTRTYLPVEDVEQVADDLEAMSDSEDVPDGTPPVPALLRLTEYVATAVGSEAAEGLRTWSTRVAARIGVHPTALHERREDARRWAARQVPPVARVMLELARDRESADERYLCRILFAREDGTHTVLHESHTVPKTPEEAARCLREAVATAVGEPGQGFHVPWVTVLVDREGLHLAVDEWNPGAPNDIVPDRPIGAEYRVTLSCPELSGKVKDRDSEQRRRWESGHAAALVTDATCGAPRQLMQLLRTSHRDTTRVVLHGPRDQRTGLLELCLALGVPVVLWDRGADRYEDADRLRRLDPLGPLAELPERVRVFRGDAFAFPGSASASPSLVWEEDGRCPAPESLQFKDPRKGAHAS